MSSLQMSVPPAVAGGSAPTHPLPLVVLTYIAGLKYNKDLGR
jgi:hypothetical protein